MLLAFGLSMGVDRYEKRRQTVVAEANAIGTTYLRAELLAEPERSHSLRMLQQYTDVRIELSDTDVDSRPFDVALSASHDLQRSLWNAPLTALRAGMNDQPAAGGPILSG